MSNFPDACGQCGESCAGRIYHSAFSGEQLCRACRDAEEADVGHGPYHVTFTEPPDCGGRGGDD